MEFEEFDELLERVRRTPAATPPDSDIKAFDFWVATDDDIRRTETQLGVRLPAQYKEFMRRYGGGAFLGVELIPMASPDSHEEDLVELNQVERLTNFVAIAPVGTGDHWGFSVVNGACKDEVDFYTWETGDVSRAASNFLEFVARYGLRALD
jgi:hypothetical protein